MRSPKRAGSRPGRAGGAHVLEGVREGEGQLLRRRRPRLADVVAGDRDGVPARDARGAVGEDVGDQAQRRRGRVDVGPARHVLLEDVVLHGAGERRLRDAAPPGHRHVEREQDGRGGVDGHGRGDAVERDPVEEGLHVLEAVDGHTHAADLARRVRIVGVVADLRGQVEGHGEAGRPALEQVAVAAVGLGRAAEAGVLPHGPEPAAVAVGVQAARVRERARLADGGGVRQVGGPVEPPRGRPEAVRNSGGALGSGGAVAFGMARHVSTGDSASAIDPPGVRGLRCL